jgi:hypothetical protein
MICVRVLRRGSYAAFCNNSSDGIYPTYQPGKRGITSGDALLKSKVRFSTYHACKGLEAHCVLALSSTSSTWLHKGYDDFDLAPPTT